MGGKYVWVIGYNKLTGEREKFIRCSENNSLFHKSLYESEGLNVSILTSEELDALVESKKSEKE